MNDLCRLACLEALLIHRIGGMVHCPCEVTPVFSNCFQPARSSTWRHPPAAPNYCASAGNPRRVRIFRAISIAREEFQLLVLCSLSIEAKTWNYQAVVAGYDISFMAIDDGAVYEAIRGQVSRLAQGHPVLCISIEDGLRL